MGLSVSRCLRALACLLAGGMLAGCSDGTDRAGVEGWRGAVVVQETPFRLQVLVDGEILLAQSGPLVLSQADGGQAALVSLLSQQGSGDARTYRVSTSAGGSATVRVASDDGAAFRVSIQAPDVTAVSVPFALHSDERIYGLTERLRDSRIVDAPGVLVPPVEEFNPDLESTLDRRGETVEMFVRPTVSLYAPFYHSSRGYGLWVEGTFPGRFDIGASRADELRFTMETGTQGLAFTILLGPEHARILGRYHERTGFPVRVPDWAFLHWRWRDELTTGVTAELDGNAVNAEIAEDVMMYQRFGIPAGVYLFDRPYLIGADDPDSQGFHSFQWDPQRLPNIEATLASLRERGFRLAVWSAAWARNNGPGSHGAEAAANGYLAPGSDRVIDLTNTAAFAWWRDKLGAFLADYGIDAIKLDRGEEFVPSEPADIYSDGRSGREVHNAFPVLQAQVHHDALRAARGEESVVLARAGYSGSQRWAASWGGDDVGTEAGLRSAIVKVQRAAFLGFPFWGSDTGGYYPFSDREVFARWLQFSALTPIMEIGGIGSRQPWDMPGEPAFDEELIAIYARYVQLHHDLQPYTVRQARKASSDGTPIARPMVFDFPDDPRFGDSWQQYMYGPDLLVAPVWRSGAREKHVLLPEGTWNLYWDRQQSWRGPTELILPAPLALLPLFVRDGAKVTD